MKTLVFAFGIEKLDEVAFGDFLKKIFDAQMGVPLGLCKFNLYEQGTIKVMDTLDVLHVETHGENAAVRCICPMCEHHRTAEKIRDEQSTS